MKQRFFFLFRYALPGQTMVEALVALAAAVIIISSITVAVITSASNTSYSTNQNKATQLAREGLDAIRKLRDIDPASFALKSGTYCLGEDKATLVKVNKPSDCTVDTRVEDIYIRTVNFIPSGDENNCGSVTEVDAVVSWADGKCPTTNQFCKNVKLVSCLSSAGTTQ